MDPAPAGSQSAPRIWPTLQWISTKSWAAPSCAVVHGTQSCTLVGTQLRPQRKPHRCLCAAGKMDFTREGGDLEVARSRDGEADLVPPGCSHNTVPRHPAHEPQEESFALPYHREGQGQRANVGHQYYNCKSAHNRWWAPPGCRMQDC